MSLESGLNDSLGERNTMTGGGRDIAKRLNWCEPAEWGQLRAITLSGGPPIQLSSANPFLEKNMQFEDILYENRNGVAWITINRPDKMNAFRGTTCDEIIKALNKAGYDRQVGCIVLAGAGEKAFCTGGDQSAHDGNYDGRGTIGLPMEELHTAIRDVPKPVIARVQGFAIGGGNVLCTICDLTICSEKAIFGQVGPKMGSVDPGYGTAFLARVVGE